MYKPTIISAVSLASTVYVAREGLMLGLDNDSFVDSWLAVALYCYKVKGGGGWGGGVCQKELIFSRNSTSQGAGVKNFILG